MALTPHCDICGEAIPEPVAGKGEYQGGRVEITFPAIVVDLYLCETHMIQHLRPLRESGTTRSGGTAPGIDQFKYLPVMP